MQSGPAAERVRSLAVSLLKALARYDADTVWLNVHELVATEPAAAVAAPFPSPLDAIVPSWNGGFPFATENPLVAARRSLLQSAPGARAAAMGPRIAAGESARELLAWLACQPEVQFKLY